MGGLLGLLNPLNALKDGLLSAQKQYLDAKNDSERLKAEENIAFWKGRIDAATAAQNDPWYSPRSLMGYAAAAYVLKIVLWDTVLQLGVTPDPGVQVWAIVATVIGFYFVSKPMERLADAMVTKAINK